MSINPNIMRNLNEFGSFAERTIHPDTQKLRWHENLGVRVAYLITIPYEYVKMIAEAVAGFFVGAAALLFGLQSVFLNEVSIGMFKKSGDSLRKIGFKVCGIFVPEWAIGQIGATNINSFKEKSTFIV